MTSRHHRLPCVSKQCVLNNIDTHNEICQFQLKRNPICLNNITEWQNQRLIHNQWSSNATKYSLWFNVFQNTFVLFFLVSSHDKSIRSYSFAVFSSNNNECKRFVVSKNCLKWRQQYNGWMVTYKMEIRRQYGTKAIRKSSSKITLRIDLFNE